MSSDAEALDIDIGACRGIVWATKCAEALNNDEILKGMRGFVRRFKRKGDEGKPGDYDKLFKDLAEAVDIEEEEEAKENLKEFLEGDDEDAWSTFSVTYNAAEEDAKSKFMEILNIIKCFPPA